MRIGALALCTSLLVSAALAAREPDPLSDVRARNQLRALKRESYDMRQRLEATRREEARLQLGRQLPDREGRTPEQRLRDEARVREEAVAQDHAIERQEGEVRDAQRNETLRRGAEREAREDIGE